MAPKYVLISVIKSSFWCMISLHFGYKNQNNMWLLNNTVTSCINLSTVPWPRKVFFPKNCCSSVALLFSMVEQALRPRGFGSLILLYMLRELSPLYFDFPCIHQHFLNSRTLVKISENVPLFLKQANQIFKFISSNLQTFLYTHRKQCYKDNYGIRDVWKTELEPIKKLRS